MRFEFDKADFVKRWHDNYLAPDLKKMNEGNLGEFVIALIFYPTFGLITAPIIALCCTKIKFTKEVV